MIHSLTSHRRLLPVAAAVLAFASAMPAVQASSHREEIGRASCRKECVP